MPKTTADYQLIDGQPLTFMQAIEARRQALNETGETKGQFSQKKLAAGLTFPVSEASYRGYLNGKGVPDHQAAEDFLVLMYDNEVDRDEARSLKGYPKEDKPSSHVLTDIATRLGLPVLPLRVLLTSVGLDSPHGKHQKEFLGTREGADINSDKLDPSESRLREIVAALDFDAAKPEDTSPALANDKGLEDFYREAVTCQQALQLRKKHIGRALWILRHRDQANNVHLPDPNPATNPPPWSFALLAGNIAGNIAGNNITATTINKWEATGQWPPDTENRLATDSDYRNIPSKTQALALANAFGFTGSFAEVDMYAKAEELYQTQAFPGKTVSPPNTASMELGQRAKLLREILGLSQEDAVLLAQSVSRDVPKSFLKRIEATGSPRKDPVPAKFQVALYEALHVKTPHDPNPARFDIDTVCAAVKHVMCARRDFLCKTLTLLRESTYSGEKADDAKVQFAKEVEHAYGELQKHYGATFKPYSLARAIKHWEQNEQDQTLQHPMFIQALVNAAGVSSEAQLYLQNGALDSEINEEAFALVQRYIDSFYKHIAQGDDKIKNRLSVFAAPSQEPTVNSNGWQEFVGPPDTRGVGPDNPGSSS